MRRNALRLYCWLSLNSIKRSSIETQSIASLHWELLKTSYNNIFIRIAVVSTAYLGVFCQKIMQARRPRSSQISF
ncbi:MAG: hypothetical protein LBB88_05130 [Planctomycetaceae bacterium]|nr:hypothetical protein [Planctomycetaceae bacterium]